MMQSLRALAVVCYVHQTIRPEKAQAVVCCDASSVLVLDLLCSGGAHLDVVDIGLQHLDPVGVLEVQHVFLPFLPPMAELVASHIFASLSFPCSLKFRSSSNSIQEIELLDLEVDPVHHVLQVEVGGGWHITVHLMPVHRWSMQYGGDREGVVNMFGLGMVSDGGVEQLDVGHDVHRDRFCKLSIGHATVNVESGEAKQCVCAALHKYNWAKQSVCTTEHRYNWAKQKVCTTCTT